jgi:hypothetical protein
MATNSFIFPASGLGFARSACLASFASGITTVSGMGYLSLGDYEEGTPYYSDGSVIIPIQGASSSMGIPSPILFGDWVYYVLGGQLPTMQATGGIEFIGGAYGGISWINIAYTGTHGLQVQTSYGGVLGFDSSLTDLSYTVTGMELFSVQFQVLDTLPQQIELQLYESTLGWHKAYVGTDQFGLGGYNAGSIPLIINNWAQMTFTPAQIGLTPGMIITGVAWGVYNTTGTSTVVFSDTSNLNQSSVTVGGFIDTCQDNNVGFYILANTGPLFRIPAVGASPLAIPLSDSPSYAYTGMTYNPTDEIPYFTGYDGTIYKYNGSVITVTAPPSGISPPARQLFNDGGSNLYTLFANSTEIGKYNIGGNTWSFITTPFTASVDTIHYSKALSTLLAGGSNYLSLNNSNTITGMSFSIADSQLLTTDSSNSINIYDTVGEGFIEWSLAQPPIPSTGNPVAIASEPDGNQALVIDTANNKLQVLTNVGGFWSSTSTVPLTAPTFIITLTSETLASEVVQALVCQPSQNTVSILNKSVLNWSVVQTLSIPSPTSIAVSESENGTLTGTVTTATGITFISFNGADWVINGSISLTPVPTLSASDFVNTENSYTYAAGFSGGNSEVYVFQDGVLIAQYSIVGTIGTLGVINFQIVSALTSGSIDVGSVVQGVVSHGIVSGVMAPTNSDLMTWIIPELGYLPILVIAGPNNIWSFYNNYPQSIVRAGGSQIAILSGVSWNLFDLKDDNKVTSITVDPSGNIYAILSDNVLYKYNSLGTLASGYPYTLVPPINQEDGVPLGFSKLLLFNGKLVASSPMMGGLTIITT